MSSEKSMALFSNESRAMLFEVRLQLLLNVDDDKSYVAACEVKRPEFKDIWLEFKCI